MNVLSSTIVATVNDPLNPLLNTPVEVPFASLSLQFLTKILSPTFKSCGATVTTVTVSDNSEQVLINL